MASVGTHERKPGKRGNVTGWSPGAARRNVAFLRSVDESTLTGFGLAMTLTIRHCPPTPGEWTAALKRWIDNQRHAGMVRMHWVMEFQRRCVPHLHVAAWYEETDEVVPIPDDLRPLYPCVATDDWFGRVQGHQLAALRAVRHWMQAMEDYQPGPKGQQVRPITDDVGWFMYLAKHCGRGRDHYQRQNASKPDAWEKCPRVWGKRGEWSTVEAADGELTRSQWFTLRRLVRSWRVAQARAVVPGPGWTWLSGSLFGRDHARDLPIIMGAAKARTGLRTRLRHLQQARAMLRCPERKLSEVRGVSEWMSEDVQQQLTAAAVSL